MLSRQPELHVRVAARQIMDRVAERGEPRAVFWKDGKLMDCPAGGAKANSYLSRNGQGLFALGVYDHGATVDQLLEDVDSIDWA